LIYSLVHLIRPVNSLMVGFAVVVGIAVASVHQLLSFATLMGFLTGFGVSAYSMIINDLYDLDVDRLNRPDKPLPSGRVSPATAMVEALILLAIGLVSAYVLGIPTLLVAAFYAFWSWLYNYRVKESGFLGNTMVATSVAIPYLYGGLSVGVTEDPLLWMMAVTSLLAAVGREVVKTISDVVGDRARRVRSVMVVYGPAVASKVGALFFIASIASSILPLVFRSAGLVYGVVVIIPIAIFAYATKKILKEYSAQNAISVKNLALIGMLTGLLAFIAGGILRT